MQGKCRAAGVKGHDICPLSIAARGLTSDHDITPLAKCYMQWLFGADCREPRIG
jgi:hypothetical protein